MATPNFQDDINLYKRLRSLLKRPSIRYMSPAERPSTAFQQKLHNQFLVSSRNLYQQSLAGSTERYARVRDYELMDTSSPISSLTLNVYADNATQLNDQGRILGIKCEEKRIKEELEVLYFDILNLEFNAWHWLRNVPIKYDSYIPLLSGENITIKELSDRIKSGIEEWVYAVQDETNRIVPGKVIWCDKNYASKKIIKVILDDDSYIETAPEHPFILRDGTKLRADELKSDMSLMPFYRKDNNRNYELIYDPYFNKYNPTHQLIADSVGIKKFDNNPTKIKFKNCLNCNKKLQKRQRKYCSCDCANKFKTIIHHINFNKRDNSPINLQEMNCEEHYIYHSKLCKNLLHTPEITRKRMLGIDKWLKSNKHKQNLSERQSGIQPEHWKKYNVNGFEDLKNKFSKISNHKVKSIEIIDEIADVYCMTVVGPNGEDDRHNFAVCSKNINGNIIKDSGVFVGNCKYGDMFLLLDVAKDKGITSFLPLPTIEIEREEGYDNDVNSTRFKWTYNSGMVYDNFQIAHFRLIGDDTFLPYGRAILEPARRPWKQYNLIFDAMLSYRISRAPERRIFYIDVGNIAPNDINQYMMGIRDSLKRQPLMDNTNGNVDLRYNAVPLDDDFFIPVRGDQKTRIDTLPGATNLNDIEDVRLLRSELINALGIPSVYVDDTELGMGRTMGAQQDLQFARSVQRLQKVFLSELMKIGVIHLFTKGVDIESLPLFSLTMTPPSAILEMQKLEVFDKRFSIFSNAIRDKGVSRRYAQKYILNLTNEDITRIDKELEADARVVSRLQTIEQGTGGAMGGGAAAFGGAGADMGSPTTGADLPRNPLAAETGGGLSDDSINVESPNDLIDADSGEDRSLQGKRKQDYLTRVVSEAYKNETQVKQLYENINRKIITSTKNSIT